MHNDHGCTRTLETQIQIPSNLLITSMEVLDKHGLLILGSRTGSIVVYEMLQAPLTQVMSPSVCYQKVHQEDAVTCIKALANPGGSLGAMPLILTTGRDGTYAIHEICYQRDDFNAGLQIEITTFHSSTLLLCTMVEGACFNLDQDLIMYGFHSKHFIVWNETQQSEIMRVNCGGAHRTWDFYFTDGGGSLIWTKASKVYFYPQTKVAHESVETGGHGREIKAVTISPLIELYSGEKTQLLATGAEDTTIRIFSYREGSSSDGLDNGASFKCIAVIKKHTTGIQALWWSKCARYLLSSGGFEEFFVWRVRQLPTVGVGVVCEGVCPTQSNMPDLRITSFYASALLSAKSEPQLPATTLLISMGYSDSSVRVGPFQTRVAGKLTSCRCSYMTASKSPSIWFAGEHTKHAA